MTEQQCSPVSEHASWAEDDYRRARDCMHSILQTAGAMIPASVFDNAFQHAVGILSLTASRLRNDAQTVTVTDAMCEAAINSDAPDCVYGFTYPSRYIIRDVYADKELWSGPVGGTAEYVAFERQCEIERMRMMLEAALAVSSTQCAEDK